MNLRIADAGNVSPKRKFMGSQGSNPTTKPDAHWLASSSGIKI